MKTYVLTLSHSFPANHEMHGNPTYFREKFYGTPGMLRKLHTIRANYTLWAKRSTLRQQFHDNIIERDNEELFELTSQIRKLQEHLANRELVFNEKLNEVQTKLQQALSDLGKISIEIHAEYRNKHSKLRQELAEKVNINRQKAQAIARQEGLLS